MSEPGEFLRTVYDLDGQPDTDAYYSAWAPTYDDEITRNGYRTPQRCAEALAQFVAFDTPILDIGCGTGLSGAAMSAVGFTDISGSDVNAEMVALVPTGEGGRYRHVWVSDPDDPLPFAVGTYGAIAAVGVIGVGAAPASLLAASLDVLQPGGHLVFSYNEHALEVAEFADALSDLTESGRSELLFSERGVHFEALGTSSMVYVLRRL